MGLGLLDWARSGIVNPSHCFQFLWNQLRLFARRKRALSRRMALYDNPWYVLLALVSVAILTFLLAYMSWGLWGVILVTDRVAFTNTPWIQRLVEAKELFQLLATAVLLAIWLVFRGWSKHTNLKYVPNLFQAKVDDLLKSYPQASFDKKILNIMKSQKGKKFESDLDLLVKTIVNDDERYRDLRYCLHRTTMSMSRRYLEYKRNEALVNTFATWLLYYTYAQLLLPVFILVAGKWSPSVGWLANDHPTLRNLTALLALLTPFIAYLRKFRGKYPKE